MSFGLGEEQSTLVSVEGAESSGLLKGYKQEELKLQGPSQPPSVCRELIHVFSGYLMMLNSQNLCLLYLSG